MARNVPVQTYLPPHIADWVGDEAARVKLSKSLWIGNMIIDLYQGQEMRDEARKNAEHVRKQLTFITCALDGLLAGHPDSTLRDRVHAAFRRKLEQERPDHLK
jgi:hypothetical protein